MRRRALDLISLGALLLAATVVFCLATHLTSVEPWRVPVQNTGDAIGSQANFVMCARQGLGCLWGERELGLGAPTGARWADFPRSEDWLWWAGGMLTRLVGLGVAANVMWLLAALAAAASMFLSARLLGVSRVLSVAAALLFAFSPFFFTRNIHHYSLTMYAPWPLGLLVWRQLAQPGAWPRRKRTAWTVLVAGVMGSLMLYYGLYFAIGVGFTVAWQVFRRNRAAALVGVKCLAATVGVVALCNVDTVLLGLDEGRNPQAVVRRAGEANYFGLQVEQLALPSVFHRFEWARHAVEPYSRRAGARGEFASSYLGVVGVCALVSLLVVEGRRAWRRRRISGSLATVLLCVLLAVPHGGIALMQALTGFSMVRSNNRVSIVLLGVVLLWLARRLTRALRGQSVMLPVVVAAATMLALWEQIPLTEPDVSPSYHAELAQEFAATAEFVERVAQHRGTPARVFVYPAADFPEDPNPPFGDTYLPLRLYLHDSPAQWSYGAIKGRAASNWPRTVAALPPAEFAAALKSHGFDALVTHTNACHTEACAKQLHDVAFALGGTTELTSGSGWFGFVW